LGGRKILEVRAAGKFGGLGGPKIFYVREDGIFLENGRFGRIGSVEASAASSRKL
jgi:hypothetical protein